MFARMSIATKANRYIPSTVTNERIWSGSTNTSCQLKGRGLDWKSGRSRVAITVAM